MIDINNSKEVFKQYVENYDMNNPKINLKYFHTLRVCDLCKDIALSIGLNDEEASLAALIGLLHDIGRFEQAKRYNSFNDAKTIDHADLGCDILVNDNFIRNFINTDTYDNIILKAVRIHNKAYIDESYNEQERLYSKIVRDADKIDILYIISNSEIKDIEDEKVSIAVKNDILNERFIDIKKTVTKADKVLVSLAFIYDLNYFYSYKVIKENKYIDTIIDKINPKTDDLINLLNKIKIDIDNIKEV